MVNYEEESIMDEHELLDLVAKSQIITRGIQYGVVAQDIDTLRKAVIDLKDCAEDMDDLVAHDFG